MAFRSLAARVPPELFKYILDYIQIRDETRYYTILDHRRHALVSKGELGSFALVCRFWADICLPMIFEKITLRSKYDWTDFITMASSPHSNFRRYTRYLKIEFTVPCEPFAHLIDPHTSSEIGRAHV